MSSTKAKRDKLSILASAKGFLSVLLPAMQKVPKIERMDGAVHEMKLSAFDIISHFTTAYNCPEARLENIQLMFGDYGRMLSCFEIANLQNVLTDNVKFELSIQLSKIEEGIVKWHNAVQTLQRQVCG